MLKALEKRFRLTERQTTIKTETGSGATTFLTSIYIMFINGILLSATGMPIKGVFVATALAAFACTLIVALYADLPLAMAPNMGTNALFASAICLGLGYHWKEALAIAFVAGVLHLIIAVTPARRAVLVSIPEHLGVAIGAGLGLLIAYIAVQSTGLFATISSTATTPAPMFASIYRGVDSTWYISIISMVIMLGLLAMERKTGLRYGALPISIIAATFICAPFRSTNLQMPTDSLVSAFRDFKTIFMSFFGSPGLLSLFANPMKALNSILIIMLFSLTNLLDSLGAIIAFRQMRTANLFDAGERDRAIANKKVPRIGRAMISNALGGVISPLLGVSASSIYLESTAGVIYGGRTGLAALVTALLFLCCIPFSNFFRIIPFAAVTPVMIYAGGTMISRLNAVNWRFIEEGLPAFLIILIIPTTGSIVDGVCAGLICHIVITAFMGKRKTIHPALYIISLAYLFARVADRIL